MLCLSKHGMTLKNDLSHKGTYKHFTYDDRAKIWIIVYLKNHKNRFLECHPKEIWRQNYDVLSGHSFSFLVFGHYTILFLLKAYLNVKRTRKKETNKQKINIVSILCLVKDFNEATKNRNMIQPPFGIRTYVNHQLLHGNGYES